MTTDALAIYELWDLTRPVIPARSRLYHLAPVSVGTPLVESLTSYIVRLAEAHCVRPRTLVTRELVPLLGRPHLAKPGDNSISAFWSKDARALNGTRTLARDWVQALETLTRRTDLRFLTLLTWADVLPTSGLLRPTRAWCPACYEEWRTGGQVVYEPLLWTLQVVAICSRHQRWLCLQCPDCQQPLPLLTSRSRPGCCPRCEAWLGSSPAVTPTDSVELPEDEWRWQTWVVDTVGELLAAAPHLMDLPRRESIAAAMTVYVEQAAGGNMNALARELRISLSAVSTWKLTRSVPQLQRLLQVC
ncbi:MAG: TniQ family protein, partial [Chloroflexi bacterium]|nr:TniQ family protein [Chloroflexota bacterium]